jgi:hypothetical protein
MVGSSERRFASTTTGDVVAGEVFDNSETERDEDSTCRPSLATHPPARRTAASDTDRANAIRRRDIGNAFKSLPR